jgi:6-phosphogluconolactonase (cycloisomerase 2 family)
MTGAGRRKSMKFRKFGKTVLTAALSSAIVFSLSSCVRSFTVGYLYVTGTVTATPSGNGIISAFKINNNNGKLTALDGFPVSSGGANPVRAVLLSGGNFVYVLNRGANKEGTGDCTTADPCLNSNITEFAVGGNGILTFQAAFFTQGINPFRLIPDSSGNYLFALDHDAPSNAYCSAVVTGATSCGDVTVFQVNSTTGRLTLVTNAQLTASTGNQVTYFPVPAQPIDFTLASNFLTTLSGVPSGTAGFTGQTVYPYSYNSSTGQLAISQSISQVINNGAGGLLGQATAITYTSGKVYILDNEAITAGNPPGQILPFTIGTNGALNALVGGAVADDPTETYPLFVITESKGKYLYVANEAGFGINNGAGLVAYTIDPTSSQLTEDPGSPFPSGTGAEPACLLEDPSNQYIYTANAGDSTVTGNLLDPNSGVLRQMQGWSGSIGINGPATYCFTTGRTN